jgi:two-component system NtrC family sensor kinase
MKIRTKVLLTTLPVSLVFTSVSIGLTVLASRQALELLAFHWLTTKSYEGVEKLGEIQSTLARYNSILSSSGVMNASDPEQGKAEARNALGNISVGKKGFVFVVDGAGKVIVHPNEKFIGTSVDKGDWFRGIKDKTSGNTVLELDGVQYLGSFSTFKQWNWVVIAADPRDEVFGVVADRQKYIFLFALFSAMILYFGILFVSRRITDPINALAVGAKRIGEGSLDTRIEVGSDDEIGDLGRSFNEMSARLQTSVSELSTAKDALQKMNVELEQRVKERTRELEDMQQTALQNAHAAGMADVSTGILHNIGNVINSVNVSAETLLETLRTSKASKAKQAISLLLEHKAELGPFFVQTDQGRTLLEFLGLVADCLQREGELMNSEVQSLRGKLELIKQVIHNQQDYARGGAFCEEVDLHKLVEDVLGFQRASLDRCGIKVEKELLSVPTLKTQRVKLSHVLLNIINNAKDAVVAVPQGEKRIQISVGCMAEKEGVFIKVSDNGVGISKDKLTMIFTHGFTTKTHGHGFGLHFCANAIKEMNGNLRVESEGEGKGASFIIEFAQDA